MPHEFTRLFFDPIVLIAVGSGYPRREHFGPMSGNLKSRLLIIGAALACAIFFLAKNGIKQGLDLVGGMYLAIQVQDSAGTMTAQARADATDQALEVIRNRIDQFGVREPVIQKFGNDRIIVELAGIDDEERAMNLVRQTAFLEFQLVKDSREFEAALPRIDRAIAAALPAGEIEQTDTSAAAPSALDLLFQDTTRRAEEAADSATAATAAPNTRPLSSLLQPGGEGEFVVAKQDMQKVQRYLALPEVRRLIPRNTELLWGDRDMGQGAQLFRQLYVLDEKPFMLGTALEDAQAGKDPQYNETIVSFQLNRPGGRTFERVTRENIQKRIAIVLDEQVKSAPVVNSVISMNGQIQMGGAPMTEARDLALVLRSGALPAKIEVIEQRQVGPSLGQDSINKGMIAGIIGIALVIVIMLVFYRVAGLLAVLALGIYCVLVLGGMAGFEATLTAPGIAGFVLSVGMAVDANVLIFERIREEVLAGRTQRMAVEEGFKHAMSAIVDSNLSTIITCLILYQVGTGPVRGFAVTLIIGVIASFFSAVFITRTFFMIYMDRKPATKPISI